MALEILKLAKLSYQAVFRWWLKNSGQKSKYLKNEKNYYDEIKSIFHHFKRLSLKQRKPTFLEDYESDFINIFWSIARSLPAGI